MSTADWEKISKKPKHIEVAEDLLVMISAGVYTDSLPSMSDLATEYGVSRVTARNGVLALQAAGIVKTQQGSQTIIVERPSETIDTDELIERELPRIADLAAFIAFQTRATAIDYEENPTPNNFKTAMTAQMKWGNLATLTEPVARRAKGLDNEGAVAGQEHLLVSLIHETFSEELVYLAELRNTAGHIPPGFTVDEA